MYRKNHLENCLIPCRGITKSFRPAVLLFCNYSSYMSKHWHDAGYDVYNFDRKFDKNYNLKVPEYSRPNNYCIGGDISDNMKIISWLLNNRKIHFVAGFPDCTELASSGARHWKSKFEKDRYFQAKATKLIVQIQTIAEIAGCAWMWENPVGAASSIMGPASFSFHPYEYGGYLPEDDVHPNYANHIPPRDAYQKKTLIWCSEDFVIPEKRPVDHVEHFTGWKKLGGKSERTKEIRSATPRGFSKAVFDANSRIHCFSKVSL